MTTVVTDSSGRFLFESVPAGDYVLVQRQPSNLLSTSDSDGANDDRIRVSVEAGAETGGHEFVEEFAGEPFLVLTKTGPDQAAVGEAVTYTFTVEHNTFFSDGSSVVDVGVVDDVAGSAAYVSGDVGGDGLLRRGERWVFEADYTIAATDPNLLINTAEVVGFNRIGEQVPANTADHATNVVFETVVEVTKSGPSTVAIGETVTYSFTVFHGADSDGSAVSGLSVVDDLAGVAEFVSGDDDGDGLLEGNERWLYQAAYTVPVGAVDPLVNTVTVSATDGDGDDATAGDVHTADVDFAPPAHRRQDRAGRGGGGPNRDLPLRRVP